MSLVKLPCRPRQLQKNRLEFSLQNPTLAIDTSPIEGEFGSQPRPVLSLVAKAEENLWSTLLENYHPLGDRVVIGEHLRYFAWIEGRPVALLLWGRASLKLAARDRLIGWSIEERKQNLHRVVNNYRFLILPWVRVKHLGSHILSANVRRISRDWQQAFGHGLEVLETFVDPDKFGGTTYRGANWILVGLTNGSGRIGPRYHHHGHRKFIFLYPLSRGLRARFRRAPPVNQIVSSISCSLSSPETWNMDGNSMIDPLTCAPVCTEKPNHALEAADLGLVAEELRIFHGQFRDVFPRREHWDNAGGYLAGLLSEKVGRCNAERLALLGPEAQRPRTVQHFLSSGAWSNEAVRFRNEQMVAEFLGEPDGMLQGEAATSPSSGRFRFSEEREEISRGCPPMVRNTWEN